MTDEPDETLRPVPPDKVRIGGQEYKILGHNADGEALYTGNQVQEDALRRVFAGGTAFSGLPRRPRDELRMPASVDMRLELCLLCRAALVVINGKIQGPASFRLDDGDVIITPHAGTCYGEHGRTPGTVAT